RVLIFVQSGLRRLGTTAISERTHNQVSVAAESIPPASSPKRYRPGSIFRCSSTHREGNGMTYTSTLTRTETDTGTLTLTNTCTHTRTYTSTDFCVRISCRCLNLRGKVKRQDCFTYRLRGQHPDEEAATARPRPRVAAGPPVNKNV